jgi:erythromycin esterase
VTRWATRNAVPIPSDLTAPGPDLDAVSRTARRARIIGLGEPGHGLSEVITLGSRYVRHLVTQGGVRAIAWEEDWTISTRVNDYLAGQRDDLDAILPTLESTWRTAEVRSLLVWLRAYNDTHVDDVRFAGVEYFATGPIAYDAVERYVAEHAPDRLPELQEHLALLRPGSDDIGAHLRAYLKITDKQPYVSAAAAVLGLVSDLGSGDAAGELAMQHARQINWWYEGFSLPFDDIPDYRDARAAQNVRWWQQYTGARTVYWAASVHVANTPRITITEPGQSDNSFASAGSFLEDWYGRGYVPIGFSFDHGTYRTGDGTLVDLPPAHPGWFERPLGEVPIDRFVLSLQRPLPPSVRSWLTAELVTRGLPDYGDASIAFGGTLQEWFDAVVHIQEVSPADPL